MADINIKSYNQMLGDMIRKIIADTPVNDIHVGAVLLTLLEAAAANDFENNTAILNVLELLNIDSTANNDLDALASNFGLSRLSALKATGFIKISDSSITKKSSTLYPIKSAPIKGSRVVYVNDASDWDQIGKVYIGRGTQNFEGPIEYGNTGTVGVDKGIINYGTFYAIFLDSALNYDHLISETVIWAQGTTDRRINSGTIVSIPSNNITPEVNFTTIQDVIIAAGEDSVIDVPVSATKAGSFANAGIGTISKFQSLPFPTATATNTTAFTSGSDIETDIDLRERIKSYTSSLARGTKASILTAIDGLSDPTEGKRVASAVITEPVAIGDPSIIYVDDGSGFEPSFAGQSVDALIKEATGNEEFLQLANFPIPRPQAINVAEAPYELTEGMTFKVLIDSVEESITFNSTDFSNISSATLVEVVTAINDKADLFRCRLTANSTKLLIYPLAHDVETIQVIGDSTANTELKFPINEFSHIKLYQNNSLLTEKEKAASLTSIEFSSWNIIASGNIVISVDGTPPQDQTFNTTDFAGQSFASLTLSDYVTAFNSKFAGITATATSSDKLLITSNKEGTESSLEILSGSLVDKMFSGVSLASTGQDSKFKLNRQNGNLQILSDIVAGDVITAGSSDTKGSVVSAASASGAFNVSNDSNGRAAKTIICVDGTEVVPRTVNPPIGSTITLSDEGNSVMRIMSSTLSTFKNIQPRDYLYIANRGHNAGTGIEAWIDETSSGLFKIVTKGSHTVAGTDTFIEVINYNASGMVVGSYSVLDSADLQAFASDVYPQIWDTSSLATPAAATLSEIVDSLNANIKGLAASIYRTNSIRITSTTEEGGSITTPVSIGSAVNVFATNGSLQEGNQSHVANKRPETDGFTTFERTQPTNAWLDRFTYTDLKGSLTANHKPYTDPSYGEILEETGGDPIDTKVTYEDSIHITSGGNKTIFRDPKIIDSSTNTVKTSNTELPKLLNDYRLGDEYHVVKNFEISSEDNMVIILDDDSVAKTVDMSFSRTGRVNSGSNGLGSGSGAIPSGSSFSADDAEGESNTDFSTLSVWGTDVNQRNTNFDNYAVWFMARNWYISGGYSAPSVEPSLMFRANTYGPVGEKFRFQIEHPLFPNRASTISHVNTPEYSLVTYTFASGVARSAGIQAGDQVSVTDLGGNIFRYTFPNTVTFGIDIESDDVLAIANDSGFSAANRGSFHIIDFVPANNTIDVYNADGVATNAGIAEQTQFIADALVNTNDGEYFDINAASGTAYRIYMDTTGADVVQPPSSGRTLLKIDISNEITAIDVAGKLAFELNALIDFSCPVSGTDTIICTDANVGTAINAVNGNLGNAWSITTLIEGVDSTHEQVSIATSVNIFPIAETTTAEIALKVNTSDLLRAVEINTGNIVKATREENVTGVAHGHTAGIDNYIQLYDGISYVKTFRNDVAPAYNFDLKTSLVLPTASPDPSIYQMDTTPVHDETELGELFKLVPITLDNLKHHMSHKALSQLEIVSNIDFSDNLRKIQIKSTLLGSQGAIEVVGGRANETQFFIFGDSDVSNVNGEDILTVKTSAFPNTLTIDDHVLLKNDGLVQRFDRLTSDDSIDVVETTSSSFEYRYNAKTTNFDDTTTITITDVSGLYSGKPVWRWTHSFAGTETLFRVQAGDIVAAYSEDVAWDNTNKIGSTGDDQFSKMTIINVDAANHFFDVVNPDGKAMASTAIGLNGFVNFYPTPIIEWKPSHSAPTWVNQIVVSISGDPVGAIFNSLIEHNLNVGDSFTLVDNNAIATTGIVNQVDSAFSFRYESSAAIGAYTGGYILKSTKTRTQYKIESLGYKDMFRLRAVAGDSPRFVDCGAAVDDLLVISGQTFKSLNNGEFRILGIENDAILFQSTSTQEELDTILPFNDELTAVTWTSNANVITGSAGSFRNLSVGTWVKKRDDEDVIYLQVLGSNTGDFTTATSVTLGGLYQGTSGTSVGVSFDQYNHVGAGQFLHTSSDIRIYEGDAVRVGDSLYVSSLIDNDWFSAGNSGTFAITHIGIDPTSFSPFIRVVNTNGLTESNKKMNIDNTSFHINEGDNNRFTSIKKISYVVTDDFNNERRAVYLTPGNRSYKWNQTNKTSINSLGKIGYSSDVVAGVDGYLYYTGLLRTIQRTVDGFEPDEATYSGRKAVGSLIEILPPLIRQVSVVIDVTTKDGVNLSEITNEIKSAVINHINTLGVSDDVILSDIIVKVMTIDGVAAVTFVTPVPSTERISIADNEKAFIQSSDISIA